MSEYGYVSIDKPFSGIRRCILSLEKIYDNGIEKFNPYEYFSSCSDKFPIHILYYAERQPTGGIVQFTYGMSNVVIIDNYCNIWILKGSGKHHTTQNAEYYNNYIFESMTCNTTPLTKEKRDLIKSIIPSNQISIYDQISCILSWYEGRVSGQSIPTLDVSQKSQMINDITACIDDKFCIYEDLIKKYQETIKDLYFRNKELEQTCVDLKTNITELESKIATLPPPPPVANRYSNDEKLQDIIISLNSQNRILKEELKLRDITNDIKHASLT